MWVGFDDWSSIKPWPKSGMLQGSDTHTFYLENKWKKKKKKGRRDEEEVGGTMEGRRGRGVRCYCTAWWWSEWVSEWVKWVGGWVREEGGVSKINKIKMGQNTALKNQKGAKPQNKKKKRRWKDKRLKAQKKDLNKKLHETPKGEEVYICKIYIKKRIYVYI